MSSLNFWKTVTIQTGNSDDKLTQAEWSSLVERLKLDIALFSKETHFHACSEGSTPWQNAVWVVSVEDSDSKSLKDMLRIRAKQYSQDSIAWTEGETEFVS